MKNCSKPDRIGLSFKWKAFSLFNILLFGSILVTILCSTFLLPPSAYWVNQQPFNKNIASSVGWTDFLNIFLHNFALAVLIATLPGIVFFPLSIGSLIYTGISNGIAAYPLTGWQFVVTLPTLVLEGEGLVVAALAGTVLGVSWLAPSWLFTEEQLSKTDTFKRTCKNCLKICLLAVAIFLIAAIVETTTMVMFP
jgi:hypothetical protein